MANIIGTRMFCCAKIEQEEWPILMAQECLVCLYGFLLPLSRNNIHLESAMDDTENKTEEKVQPKFNLFFQLF